MLHLTKSAWLWHLYGSFHDAFCCWIILLHDRQKNKTPAIHVTKAGHLNPSCSSALENTFDDQVMSQSWDVAPNTRIGTSHYCKNAVFPELDEYINTHMSDNKSCFLEFIDASGPMIEKGLKNSWRGHILHIGSWEAWCSQ